MLVTAVRQSFTSVTSLERRFAVLSMGTSLLWPQRDSEAQLRSVTTIIGATSYGSH